MADDPPGPEEATASPDELLKGPEVREGYVVGETFDAKPVKYSVVDGLAIFEGDFVLGTVDQVVPKGYRRASRALYGLDEDSRIAQVKGAKGWPPQEPFLTRAGAEHRSSWTPLFIGEFSTS